MNVTVTIVNDAFADGAAVNENGTATYMPNNNVDATDVYWFDIR